MSSKKKKVEVVEKAPKGYVFLWHPIIGRVERTEQHANNLLESEKKTPSGWVAWTNQPF